MKNNKQNVNEHKMLMCTRYEEHIYSLNIGITLMVYSCYYSHKYGYLLHVDFLTLISYRNCWLFFIYRWFSVALQIQNKATLWYNLLYIACADPGSPVALIFFIIVLLCIIIAGVFLLYQKNKHRFHSTVRYQRNFDDADSTSIINNAE